jgi:hypothetical protein
MRHFTKIVLALLLPSFGLGQPVTDTSKRFEAKPITDTSQIKLVIRDGFQGECSYYLNGKKIDIKRYFISVNNIQEISVVKSANTNQIFNDSAKGGIVFIKTKANTKLVTLPVLLKLNNIEYYELDPNEIRINDHQLLDTATIIDSKAKVIPIYKKDAAQTPGVKARIIGVSIYTDGMAKK